MKTNEEVVMAYVAAFNGANLPALIEQFAPDACIWGVLGWGSLEVAAPVWQDLMECLQINLQVDALITQGDEVCVRYTERGTSVKSFRGMGPTGKSYELTAMEWFEIKGGLICRRWGARDSASQNRQLGFQ